MKRLKYAAAFVSAAGLLLSLTACGNEDSSETQQVVKPTAVQTEAASKLTASKIISAPNENAVVNVVRKAFRYKFHSISVLMNDNGWKLVSGGTATEEQCDEITESHAVMSYLDTDTTLTFDIFFKNKEKDDFLAMTEESYLSEYGGDYESIDITAFKKIVIDEYDSFEIKADVTKDGKKYSMTQILTNDADGRSCSWVFLDCDGSLSDFSLADAINYPVVTNEEMQELIRKRNDNKREQRGRIDREEYFNLN
ncbi:MAG: hypothetical protein E7508_05080 [Ruminococcus sp.]|nr:hypothetical protein [Ruminococcus sp.]